MAKRKSNGKIIHISGWVIFMIGILLLFFGYLFKDNIKFLNIQINLVPSGWIALGFGILILIFHYLSHN
ncbi:hypothetical protein GF386_05200 [Candidatus Pacearchaeota archaeon]|nr:hypothetical protein [Candidatus Pacearchaeota archaeon]MBD3283506.1 hypothetical protein [Candidatus Pacearchaeota archaeon]